MPHTPGPWTVEVRGTKSNTWWDVNTATVHGGISVNTGEADARLIAAAPELLVALKAMVAMVECEYARFDSVPEWQQATAALAKAEGRDE